MIPRHFKDRPYGFEQSPGTGCFVTISFPPCPIIVGQTFSGIATARPASQDRPAATMAFTATIIGN